MKSFLRENKAMIIRIFISICLIIAGLIVNGKNEFVGMVLYIFAYILNAYKVIYLAIKKMIIKHEIGEKMLMSIASLGAIMVGAYFEASFVIVLYLIGELIEDNAGSRNRSSLENLGKICPKTARLRANASEVPVESVLVGEIIEVYPGETIPLDGVIVDGSTDIDTSVVTGESVPDFFHVGGEVFAGYINLTGVIAVRVVRENKHSMVQRIIDVSLGEVSKKAKSETFIKKFAKIYTPVVIGISALTIVIPSLFGADIFDWAYKAFSLLAISCPCAIVISVPLAYSSGIGFGARRGILIKGSQSLEKLSTINTMAFDKTGTLTKADLRVNKVESCSNYTKMEILEIAGIAEKKSNHPIGVAVLKEAERFKINNEVAKKYKEHLGKGVECESSRGKIKVGTFDFAGGSVPSSSATIYVSLNDECIGYIGVGDNLKENGKKAFDSLREDGIEKIYILSGDKKSKVDAVASTLYADGAYSQLLPEHKLDALEDIVLSGKNVKIAYCGDGINDLMCLSRADIGVSMGSLGLDGAVEKSDVVITDGDIEKISLAYKIAKKTKKKIITNIAFALGVKLLVTVLNFAVPVFPMFICVLSDVGVMLATVLNSVLINKKSI